MTLALCFQTAQLFEFNKLKRVNVVTIEQPPVMEICVFNSLLLLPSPENRHPPSVFTNCKNNGFTIEGFDFTTYLEAELGSFVHVVRQNTLRQHVQAASEHGVFKGTVLEGKDQETIVPTLVVLLRMNETDPRFLELWRRPLATGNQPSGWHRLLIAATVERVGREMDEEGPHPTSHK